MMAAEPGRHEGQRPYSAGDDARRHLPSGEPPPLPFRRGSSLERGIIGAPPPLVRDSDHRFTAAEVERLLAVREQELLSVKRRLHRASKKNDALESTVSALKEEGSGLRRTVEEGTAHQDDLQLRVTGLEDVVKRKTIALKTSNQRRERVEETAKAETAQARGTAELARSALEEAGRKGSSLKERAQYAETRVKSLELRLEASKAQAAEANRAAAEDLRGRVSAHERDLVELEAAVSAAEEENRGLREKLAEVLEGVRQKQEAEGQTDKVVRGLQAWRERVASGDVVEMSLSEAKRLRWSEEQAELMKEANANLRSQLLESGRLLAEAEHSFETVTAGVGDAGGTIAGLSARLDQKQKGVLEAERGLRASRAEASRLKKCVTSLQLGLSEEHRRVRGRERALDSTRKGIEALVRGKQEEMEAKAREVGKRRAAERAGAKTSVEKESLRLRAEIAEECSREMDAERRVLLQHLAAAHEEAALLRSQKRPGLSPSRARTAPGPEPTATTRNSTISINDNESPNRSSGGGPVGWREMIRSLLERAVSDWSVKSLLRPVGTPTADRKDRSKQNPSSHSSEEESSSDSVPQAFPGVAALMKTATEVATPVMKTTDRLAVAAVGSGMRVGHDSAGSRRQRRNRLREPGCSGDITDVPGPLEVVRVYGAPENEVSNRAAGWRWDLEMPKCARANDSHGTGEILAVLGLRTLGRSLRERGVRGEGARMALTAVARLLHALHLTRSLAAQQCGQVRTELALALGRLSTRSSLVSNTRTAARRASNCSRTLLLRLVDLELRCWRGRAATAAASGFREGVETTTLDGEDKDGDHAYENTDDTSSSQSTDDGNQTDDDDLNAERSANERANDRGGKQTSDLSPRKKMGFGGELRPKRSSAGTGTVLNLSNVGVDDETLRQVVRKVLRTCIHGSHRQLNTPGEDRLCVDGSSKANAVVLLTRLLLRGNSITDAGALALVPLVKESPHLTELDLRDNAIGANGKLALKKALTSNPWVHRVISEDLCDALGKRGGVGGLVLRGKRRPRSTASSDRARAYAFERIPPSFNASPSRLDSLGSIDGKPTEYEDTTTTSASCSRAPAYGGSEAHKRGGEQRRLSLMQPLALESSSSALYAVVAPSCKIDFRGCSRRPLTLPLISTWGSGSRGSPPLSAQGGSSRPEGKYDRHRAGRRHRGRGASVGSPGISTTPGRLDPGNTGGRTVYLAQSDAGVMSTNLRGAAGAASRRQRHTRCLKRADRDDDYPHPVNSEAEDVDGLALLLSVSRRIFRKAEGFEETGKRLEEPPCTSRASVRTHIGLAEVCAVERSQPVESRPPVTSRASGGNAARSEDTSAPNSSPPSGDRDHSSSSRPSRGICQSRAPRRHKKSSRAANKTETVPNAAEVVEESRGHGRVNDSYDDKEETRERTQPGSILEPSEEHSALEEKPANESTPAPIEGDQALKTPDVKQQASFMTGDLVHNTSTSPQALESDYTAPQMAGASTLLPPVARKASAVVVDSAIWDEAQQTSDNAGWAYDEATSSWYAAAATASGSVGIDETQVYADQGWRFDKQSATWHQDESVWQGQGPHEPSYIEAAEHAAVTTEVLDDQRAPGENYVERMGVPDDERMETTCEMQLNQGIEHETVKSDEAGGLLAKRIKALELALQNRSRS